MRTKLTVIGTAVAVLAAAVAIALFVRPWEDGGLLGSDPGESRSAEFVRAIGGPSDAPLKRPVAVLAHDGRIYVADSRRGLIEVFSPGGHHFGSWGQGVLRTPVAIARNPRSGEFYVVDRGTDRIVIFRADGTAMGTFAARVPASGSQGATPTAQWSPLGLDFTADGYLYVTEVRDRHRLLIFDPSGVFEAEAGPSADSTPGVPGTSSPAGELSFPTAVRVRGNEVWVSDSNNMRLRVYDLAGRLVRSVPAPRLPRGLDFAPGDMEPGTVLVADPMGHRVQALDAATGRAKAGFGSYGSARDRFAYPNAVAVGDGDLLYVADTGNARIAVWSWTGRASWFSSSPWRWSLLGIPLLPLFALPFVFRRPRYFVTRDFITTLHEVGEIEAFTEARARWECLPEDWGVLQRNQHEGGPLVVGLTPVVGSDSDANVLRERYHLDEREAAVLSAARGSSVLFTQDAAIIRVAQVLGMRAEDVESFLSRLASEQERRRRNGRGAERMAVEEPDESIIEQSWNDQDSAGR